MAANPTTQLFRLPSEAEARSILKDASTLPANSLHTPQGKAQRNLYKGIDWAFKGLVANQKLAANTAYKRLSNVANADLGTDFVDEKSAIAPDRVVAAIKALNSAESNLSHSGHDRLQELSKPQLTNLDQVLLAGANHIRQMLAGTHDAQLDRIFPLDASKPKLQSAADVRKRVLLTFTKGYEAITEYRRSGSVPIFDWKSINFKVDSYSDAIRAAGLTSREEMKLATSFFTKSLQEREASLLHESTHAIKEEKYRTNDNGGYIGSAKFDTSVLKERLKNAGHYEAVIRLINSEALAIPDNAATSPEALKANETLRKAWDKALNLYGDVQKLGSGTLKGPGNLAMLRDLACLFGLSGYQGLAGTTDLPARSVSGADLAAFENRVSMLGGMVPSDVTAAAVIALNQAGTPLTERAILLKVIEQKGTIRKTTDPVKTLDMIDTLANFTLPKMQAFQLKYPLR